MADTKPLVIETAVIAWEDAFRAIGAMPVVASIAFVLVLVWELGLAIVPKLGRTWFFVIPIGSSIVWAMLLAPLAIAVHRFVLLGEKTNRYPLEPGSSRYQHFVGFAILVKILWLTPNVGLTWLVLNKMISALAAANIVGLLLITLYITVTTIVVPCAILFPAIAIDAPGARWRNAWLDTQGSFWRVAFIFVLTYLPLFLLTELPFLVIPFYGVLLPPQWERLVYPAIGVVVAVPAVCAFAAAASHIYRVRANVMTRPSGKRLLGASAPS